MINDQQPDERILLHESDREQAVRYRLAQCDTLGTGHCTLRTRPGRATPICLRWGA